MTPIDVAMAKSTMLGACINMESLGGSWHNGWESKNFPLMQKGNLRIKFIWFPFATNEMCSMLQARHQTARNKQDKLCLFKHKNKNRVLFDATRFGYEVRYPRAGQDFVFGSVLRGCALVHGLDTGGYPRAGQT
jgi:hypothetical protein